MVQFIFLLSAFFDLSQYEGAWILTHEQNKSLKSKSKKWCQRWTKYKKDSVTRGVSISKVTIFGYLLYISPFEKTVLWDNVVKRSSSSLCWPHALSWGRVKATYEEWLRGQKRGGCRKVEKCVQTSGLRSTAMWGWIRSNFIWLLI